MSDTVDLIWNGFRICRVRDPLGSFFRLPQSENAALPELHLPEGCVVLPGFMDVHVHFREPGYEQKETIRTGSLAAARGGYTTVCTMPNLEPAPDNAAHLATQLRAIQQDGVIRILPWGTITRKRAGRELSDMEQIAELTAGFSDDGSGVQDEQVMRDAMLRAKSLKKCISAHCEDTSLLRPDWCVHDGQYARLHALPANDPASEWSQVKRDLRLAEETGCSYHVCHISSRESVRLIRKAKSRGVDVTCETAPHYLLLDDSMLRDEGNFRMNPPIRSREDCEALLEGIVDGTIDMIATDHAPHTKKEKAGGLRGSLNGIVGLETAFPVLYTKLVKEGVISLRRLMELMSLAPRGRFGDGIQQDPTGDYTIFDLSDGYAVDPEEFCSMGHSSPFIGWEVYGRCLLTVCNGKTAWVDPQRIKTDK